MCECTEQNTHQHTEQKNVTHQPPVQGQAGVDITMIKRMKISESEDNLIDFFSNVVFLQDTVHEQLVQPEVIK